MRLSSNDGSTSIGSVTAFGGEKIGINRRSETLAWATIPTKSTLVVSVE
ncbi:hypothetical protein [Haloquadratum walsbyi]|nr:hypothetical protein [Haloquadratum walsbyi]